jgi:nucleotide-binding universal stress UspA family protein
MCERYMLCIVIGNDDEHSTMGTIVLATDGSDFANAAAETAIDLAKQSHDTLRVICVVDRAKFSEPALSSGELATIDAEDHAASCISEVAEMAAEEGVAVEGVTRHGVPQETILEYAGEVGADRIIIGEHGDHDRHFSGVGKKLSEAAETDVIVVSPRGE